MRDILPLDPMTYKKQRKENELITKLRIIKLVKKDGYKKAMVARKFMCHRNTVGNIVKLFETKIPKEKQVEILSNPSLELEDLKKLLAPIENRSTKPRSNRRSAVMKQVAAIKKIFNEKNVKVGPYRMKTLLRRKYGGTHSERHQVTELERSLAEMKIGCLRGLYKREKLKIKKRRSANGELRPLYDYRSLACFERLHYDTKEITDSHALPTEIYEKFKLKKSLPVFEWNIIDAKSRFRFMAYSHNLNSEFGLRYLLFVIQFIRAKLSNYGEKILIGADNGVEFCSSSERKETKWNDLLRVLNAKFYSYEPGRDIRKNLIERSHRTDDEEFFIPRGEFINDEGDFLEEARAYAFYFNAQRSHSGIGMNGRTPLRVIKDSGIIGAERLLDFPVLIMEKNINDLRACTQTVELAAEKDRYFKKFGSYKMDQKTFCDLKTRLNFLDQSAQNVLTYYHRVVICLRY